MIICKIGMYGTKEELEDTEDFYPFVYIPINIFWLRIDILDLYIFYYLN